MPELSRRDLLKATAATSMLLGLPALSGGAEASTMDDPLALFVNLRFGMFLHFNMGTFHDAEWVDPGQDPKSFAPAALDCGQWADAAKAAGMTFGVLTTKHHDGFCLWPSKLTCYTVANSSPNVTRIPWAMAATFLTIDILQVYDGTQAHMGAFGAHPLGSKAALWFTFVHG